MTTTATHVFAEIAAGIRYVLRDPLLELSQITHFEDLPGWDSLHHVAVMVEAECRFDIMFEVPEIHQVRSVDDLVRAVVAKQTSIAA
jgi:acyl carrier protein